MSCTLKGRAPVPLTGRIELVLRRFFPVFFEHIQYDLHAAELLRVLCNSNAKLVEVSSLLPVTRYKNP